MNKYNVHQQVGKGVLGMSYICTEQGQSTQLILKELECQDITSAQRALEELKIFHLLNHRFIAKLKDTYVKWDNKTSTAYICYVMDYYKKGTLGSFLNILRANGNPIPFSSISRWIGNLVESVNFLHENQVVHRNLKPGSFYLNAADTTVAFESQLIAGDFGVSTLMRDAWTKTRILHGAFDYVAPEVIDLQSFNYKTDVWTIGTILLDICTTSIYSPKQLHSHLLNIRHDEELLHRILEDIYNLYESKSLVKVIKKALNLSSEKRSSIKALVNDDFVQECLELIDSKLVIESRRSELHQVNKVKSSSMDGLFARLHDEFENEAAAQLITTNIAKIVHTIEVDGVGRRDDQSDILLRLMQVYASNPQIQLNTIDILEATLRLLVAQKRLEQNSGVLSHDSLGAKFLERFFYIFLKYDGVKEIQLSSIKVIIQLANFENASNILASYDVVKYLLRTLKNYESEPLIAGHVCKAIWSLCIHDKIMKTLPSKNCLAYTKHVLTKHRDNSLCVEMACNVVIAMCTNERLVSTEEMEVDVTSAILLGLQQQLDSANTVKSVCLALCSLIALFEECAFRFLYLASEDLEGLELLRQAYLKHKDESEIVEHICSVYKELTIYDEMVIEMKSCRLNETLLKEIEKRYRDNREISDLCSIVNEKIDEKIRLEVIAAANA